MPSVTLFVSSYNQLDLLKVALTSATDQTVPYDEIIVVDDASSDGTPEFLRNWESEGTNRRVVLLGENVGLGEVRNIGFDLVTSDYLAVLDGDDWLAPDASAQVKDVLDHTQPDMLTFRAKYYSEAEGRFMNTLRANSFFNLDAFSKGSLKTAEDKAAIFRLIPATWAKVHRMDFLRENRMKFLFRTYEGLLWHHQCAVLSDEFLCVDKEIINYRVHNSSILGAQSAEHFFMFTALDTCEDFMKSTPKAEGLRKASHRYQFNMTANIPLTTARIPEDLRPKYAAEILKRPHMTGFEMDDRERDLVEQLRVLAGDEFTD